MAGLWLELAVELVEVVLWLVEEVVLWLVEEVVLWFVEAEAEL